MYVVRISYYITISISREVEGVKTRGRPRLLDFDIECERFLFVQCTLKSIGTDTFIFIEYVTRSNVKEERRVD